MRKLILTIFGVLLSFCLAGCGSSTNEYILDYGHAALDSINRYEAREIDKDELQSRFDYYDEQCDAWLATNEATSNETDICFEIDTLTTANDDESIVAKYVAEKKKNLENALGGSEATTVDYIEKGYIEWLANGSGRMP